MKVYCYHEQIPGMEPDMQLLDCWRRSWRAFGWEPVVLSREDAVREQPHAAKHMLASAELGRGPCPEGYNYATHLRWLAFTGGLITDYDVMNNGFTPGDLENLVAQMGRRRPIFLNACPCCCVVYADSPSAVYDLAARILAHADEADNAPHKWGGELSFVCHDQAIFERFKDDWDYPPKSYVAEYTTEGWQNAPLIHFPNAKTRSPRGKVVESLGLKGLR